MQIIGAAGAPEVKRGVFRLLFLRLFFLGLRLAVRVLAPAVVRRAVALVSRGILTGALLRLARFRLWLRLLRLRDALLILRCRLLLLLLLRPPCR